MAYKHPNVEAANRWARDVVRGRKPACRFVQLACQRHLDDLVKSKSAGFPYKFDPKKAEKKLALAQMMPHVKGEWAFKRQLITLELGRNLAWPRRSAG